MAKRLITERLAFSGGRVDLSDPANPVVRDVLLCGATSANRRRYLDQATAGERIKRYEGVWVNMNHGKGRESRRYEDRLAKVANPRHRADGRPIGDLLVRPKHPMAAQFLWDAEHDPSSIGMSHVAQCEAVTSSDGWEEITEVVSVESVDIVTDPATTKGLFEGKSVPTTLKQLAESFATRFPKATPAQRKFLLFLEDDMGLADMPVDTPLPEEPADEGHEAAVDSAFESAGHAIWTAYTKGEIDIDEVSRKLKELAKGHTKVQNGGKKNGDDTSDSDDSAGDDDMPKESKKPSLEVVLQECDALEYTPTAAERAALAGMADADSRKKFVAEQKALRANLRAERPQSSARKPGDAGGGKKTEAVEEQLGWVD